jgi:hopanoid biosynthesis associated RND transporter like protein HpnN
MGMRGGGFVLLLATAVTAGALYYAAHHLGVNSNTKAMLSNDLPFRRMIAQMHTAFPQLGEPIILVIDADTSEHARDAARDLANRLTQHPELFQNVFAPGVGTYFETHGLLYVDVDTLEKFSDRVIEALPFISALAREPTLDRLFSLINGAITREDPGRLTPTRLPDLMDAVSTMLEAPLSDESGSFSWRSWILGSDPDAEEGTRRIVLALPILDYDDMLAARRPIAAVREAIEDLGLVDDPNVTVRVSGNPAMGLDEMTLVVEQAGVLAVVASFLAVTFLLFYSMRSGRLVAATLLPLVFGLAWTTAFAAAAIGHLNMVSIAFAVLFIGLGVDFGIHFALQYRELVDAGRESADALASAGRDVGGSIALCATTTAIGFYAFIPTQYAGVAELGLIAGTGMFFSLIATLLLSPAVLSIWPVVPRPDLSERRRHEPGMSALPSRYPRAVIGVAAVVALAAATTLPQVHFDPDPLKVRDPTVESVRALTDLVLDSSEPPWSVEIMAPNLEEADRVAAEVATMDTVGRTVTLSNFIPTDQEEKIEILDDLSFFFEPLVYYTKTTPPVTTGDATIAAVETLKKSMAARAELDKDDEAMLVGMARLDTALDRVLAHLRAGDSTDRAAARLEKTMLGELPGWIGQLNRALTPGIVGVDDLPPDLRARYVAADGSARVEIFPSGDLSQHGRLDEFVTSIQAVEPASGGYAVEIIESGRAIVQALRQAFSTALAIVAALLLLLWRSVRDALIVLTTLLFAALMTAAATVTLELPFNFADVIVLPLLLGVGVDSGIHLVHRHRLGAQGGEILQTSTARAVLFSALTTIASFGTLGFSTHLGMASLGKLLTTGLVFMLIANLVFLPALLALSDGRDRNNEGSV